jgi:Flp pilus assembly protein TadD
MRTGDGAVSPADRFQRATAYEAAGRLAEAEAEIDAVLCEAREYADAVHLKGVVAFKRGRPEEGAALIEEAVALDRPKPIYYRNLCEVYRVLGRYDEALEAGCTALAANPFDAESHRNLSVLYYARGQPEEAITAAEHALALDPSLPGAHFGLAEALLLRGRFSRGWEEYEWRFKLRGVPSLMPRTDLPQWDGGMLPNDRLLLVADQGFGDGIQFARYIPWAAARCRELVVACSRELQPILRQLPGIKLLFDRWEEAPRAAAYSPLSGLPRLHGTRLDTIPAGIPYLSADPARVAVWAARLAGLTARHHRRIGLVWAGRPTHNNDRNRSTTLDSLAPLGELEEVSFVSLQKGAARAQIGGYFGKAPLVNLASEIADFADTMAVLAALDLIVTVDTAVAHLAGAMGRPVWIMLPFAPDWRWLQDRVDSPWYPTARLFRQSAPRRWDSVVMPIVEALRRFGTTGKIP